MLTPSPEVALYEPVICVPFADWANTADGNSAAHIKVAPHIHALTKAGMPATEPNPSILASESLRDIDEQRCLKKLMRWSIFTPW